jgi:hypothetical protein
LDREPKNRLPKAARYPLFMVGLLILVFGELATYASHAGTDVGAGVALIGYAFLMLSVVLR